MDKFDTSRLPAAPQPTADGETVAAAAAPTGAERGVSEQDATRGLAEEKTTAVAGTTGSGG
jgi:hypothetical protein